MADTLLTRNREEDSKRGDSAEVLILILDANPLSWSESLNIKHSMEQILVFLNSFLLLHHSNRLAVIANHPTKAEIIYPSPPSLIDNQNAAIKAMSKSKRDETSVKVPKADKKRAREVLSLLRNPTSRISSKLKEISRIPLPRATPRRSRLSGSMSIALCYIRRCVAEAASKGRTVEPRILVIDTAGCVGGGGEYVPIMNAIFSARKMGIQIDSLCLSKSKDQHFLQQASDITGGIYQKLGDISSLLQTLVALNAIDPNSIEFQPNSLSTHKQLSKSLSIIVSL
ncbi:hypothetical protein AAMO2058_001009800 [Amorphochlora amoebiformis]